MKNVFKFSSRYDSARGLMQRLCLLCLIFVWGCNITLHAESEGKAVEKSDKQVSQQQKELLLRGLVTDKDGMYSTSGRDLVTVKMNDGVVIKYNANQKYTSDGVSAAIFKLICERANVPYQTYCNRADMPGGSTLGSIANTKVSLNTVDIGIAQLAMHSSFETAGKDDTEYMVRALEKFYSSSMRATESGYVLN